MAELALTVKEAAAVTGLSESTVYWLVYRNEIPHRRIKAKGCQGKGKILISRAGLEKWLMGTDTSVSERSGVYNKERGGKRIV
jgi:excisionase family DNA binding protein